MKPTNVIDMTRSGDLGGQKVAMKFDENSIAHIMSVLTDLYSDPELAVIREYSTNARDSHIAAGTTRPIEVTLPNGMNPFFKIRDYGLGLSVSDINDIYSKYGASTKRDSDTQTGMLGLGCKSALTYTSQFTIVSVKNGVKATVVVSRVEDGTGVMEIVDTVASNEPNGVEIVVPVKPNNTFARKALHFFSFWKEGTVLLNGEQAKRVALTKVTDTIGIGQNLGNDYIVMGGVPYPVENGGLYTARRPYNDPFNVVAFVEIGEVNFTPSREALSYTKRTEATVERLRRDVVTHLRATAQKEIDAAATHWDAFAVYQTWQNRLGNTVIPHGTLYRGVAIPQQFTIAGNYTVWHSNYSRGQVRTGYSTIDHGTVHQGIVITDYDDVQITARHKDKIRHWKRENNVSANQHFFVKADTIAPWTRPEQVVSWKTIKAITLPGATPGQKNPPQYTVYGADGYQTKVLGLDSTKTPVYVGTRNHLPASNVKALYAAHPSIQIVELAENRVAKFMRENPKATTLSTFLMADVNKTRDALTEQDRRIIGMDVYERGRVKALDPTRIGDPAIVEAISIAKGMVTTPAVIAYQKVVQTARFGSVYVPDLPSKSALDGYPLLGNAGRGTLVEKHTYLYMNAVYAAAQAEKAIANS